jgi:hypothetical protein
MPIDYIRVAVNAVLPEASEIDNAASCLYNCVLSQELVTVSTILYNCQRLLNSDTTHSLIEPSAFTSS